jgi:hypothetical protein
MKDKVALVLLGLAVLALTACGPSEEEIALRVSIAETATATLWTPTPTSTPTPMPTSTPTLTSTPTPTETPTPALQEGAGIMQSDLPDGFGDLTLRDAEMADALAATTGPDLGLSVDPESYSYSSFASGREEIFAEWLFYPLTPDEIESIDQLLAYGLADKETAAQVIAGTEEVPEAVELLPGADSIGDASLGIAFTDTVNAARFELTYVRRENVLEVLMLVYPPTSSSQIDVVGLALLFDERVVEHLQ